MNENMKLLIKVMDLEVPKPHSLEVTRYEHVEGVGIVISQVKVLDKNNKYIKFAKLKELIPYISRFPVKFKSNAREQDTSKTD